jgi:hypothetical protein
MMGYRTPNIDRIASEGAVGLAAAKEGSSEIAETAALWGARRNVINQYIIRRLPI